MKPYLIAELGHNWAPDPQTAIRMVEAAAAAGADAVKIQCRTLPDAIPEAQRQKPKALPWDPETVLPYVEYRKLCELDEEGIDAVAMKAAELGLDFGASCWDRQAVVKLLHQKPDFIKIASASITDLVLVGDHAGAAHVHQVPLLVSTGATTWEQVDAAMEVCREVGCETWLAQCCSEYPAPPSSLNLLAIPEMIRRYPWARVGYSNHAVSIAPSIAAIGLGASWVECHFTLDRSMPGTDQASSFEPSGLRKLRQYADVAWAARGSAEKAPTEAEKRMMAKLRRVG